MATTIALIGLACLIAVLLIILARSGRKTGRRGSTAKKGAPEADEKKKKLRSCPLCAAPLGAGERVHSVVFPGEGDKLMEIHGCPYCFPPSPKHSRICPVCKRQLDPDDHVMARMFEKPGRKHVHVLGCGKCYRNRRR